MMLPAGSRLTTEGQSVEPFGPGIHVGSPVFGSTYATRLLVVPRSIPTVRGICLNLDSANEKPQVHKPDLSYREPLAKTWPVPKKLFTNYESSFWTLVTRFL